MPVRFTCTSCQGTLSIGRRKIGCEITCPRCQATLVVPGREEGGIVQTLGRLTHPESSDVATLPELIVYDDVPRIVDAPRRAPSPQTPAEEYAYDPRLVAVSRNFIYFQGALIGVLALVAFVLGFLLGYANQPPAKPAPANPTAESVPT